MATPGGEFDRSGLRDQQDKVFALERDAHLLVERLPELLIESERIASTVAHGTHGRRRAGPGETFWQFRQYEPQDAAQLIDWRRSASSEHLYVREREWEAAHTLWLWSDLSRSMGFRSHLAKVTKRDRALVLMLAMAELLVRSGERVGLLGLTQPSASRKATTRVAEAIAAHADALFLSRSQPPNARVDRFSGVILIGDFLDPLEATREHVEALAASGATGHLVQVLDPAEVTLPYAGRVEFVAIDGEERWVADRVEALRARYQTRLKAHQGELSALATRLGWSLLIHHTDRPAAETLLALIMRLEGGSDSYRWQGTAVPSRGAP